MRGFFIAILILAGLGMAVGATIITSSDENARVVEEVSDERFSSPNVMVYAYWAGDKSEVKSFDLATGEDRLLATLPLNIKHVKLLSPGEIIYINETDENDYGASIVIKNISGGQERIVAQADGDVKIDDYRISPNGQYVATWEVATDPTTGQLYNGVSRVYGVDINTGVKNQIVTELANTPVHYPVAVTNEGKVFMDKFLPNDSAGWAYGISTADINGGNLQDLGVVANGTYGSQPVLSADGGSLVFTGYDGAKGPGTEIVRDVRRAVLSANTVDVLDLNTLSRKRLANLSDKNYYANAWWDETSGNVLFSMSSKIADQTGTYSYNLPSGLFDKVISGGLDSVSSGPKKTLSVLSPGVSLIGSVTTSGSTLGNLGSHYEQVLDGVYIYNQNENDIVSLDIVNGFVQPIAVKPSSYFGSSLNSLAGDSNADSGGLKGKTQEQLQLQTFTIKPTLEPKRVGQQSGERCRDIVASICNELLGTNYSPAQAAEVISVVADNLSTSQEFNSCVSEQWTAAKSAGCSNSPLYLYGEKGASVNVKVGTPVANSNAPYSPEFGYSGILTGDGGVNINGRAYASLEFDYDLAANYVVPSNGVIVNRNEIDKKISEYAANLGMNEKETYDFIKYVKSETKSGRIFITHFSNQISKKLLPLYFTPQPDSYTNIVFYINDTGIILDNTPQLPLFEKIKRDGFTAVEISFILNN